MSLDLPPTFAFSQSSLQAYADCPRRFWLTYVERLPWPAVEAGPIQEYEEQIRAGSAFHQLVQRTETGLDADLLAGRLREPLDSWFADYRRHRPQDLPIPDAPAAGESLSAETVLSIPFANAHGNFRLAAKYDLIATTAESRVLIVDWKTGRQRARRHTLQSRLQTIVYPYVLVEASAALPWGPVEPEQVEMIYWFTAAPDDPEIFRYSADLHMANRTRLQQLLSEVLTGESERDFPRIPDTEQNRQRFCGYCVYRSRCNRGETAGTLDALTDLEDFVIDLSTALEFTLDEVEEMAF